MKSLLRVFGIFLTIGSSQTGFLFFQVELLLTPAAFIHTRVEFIFSFQIQRKLEFKASVSICFWLIIRARGRTWKTWTPSNWRSLQSNQEDGAGWWVHAFSTALNNAFIYLFIYLFVLVAGRNNTQPKVGCRCFQPVLVVPADLALLYRGL